MPTLYVIATPLGNLKDITLRALDTLKKVDLILAEDTRITKKLLSFYNIKKQVISYHQHSKLKKIKLILKMVESGKNLALVSDAGTPAISDPGGKLISFLLERLKDKIEIVPIPGPSALLAAASVSGFFMDRFLFLGFLPKKKKRKKFLQEILNSKYPVIFYESKFRILKTLEELKSMKENLQVFVAKEITKKFESFFRGKISEVIEKLKKVEIKGEFVIVVKPN